MATVSHQPVDASVIRRHYSDLSKAIGPFPELLLSVSNGFYQHSLIDLQTKVDINRSSGLTGASMLLDHVMMKIEQSDQYLPLVMDVLREEVALTDIIHKMEEGTAEPSGVPTDIGALEGGSAPISPAASDTNITVADTISAAERLKDAFESLCFVAMMIINRTAINLALLKLKICLRLQYTRGNTPPEVRDHLTELEECTKPELVVMFLINRNFLGYLNFDLLEAFKPVLSSDKFDKKLEEYQSAHKQFIMNNFHNIVEAFQQNEDIRPASIVGLPKIKVELATPWKSKSLYYWKELVNDIVDWGPYIVITRVEFNCISITYLVLPFIIPRVVKDLTNETIMKRFTAIGATFTIPDELVQDGIADNQWIMDGTVREQVLLKKIRSSEEGDDPVINESNETTDEPLEEVIPKKVTGGYDDKMFLSSPPEDLQCPVCYLTVREPYQLSCCGAMLCQVCSDSASASVQCPRCRDTTHQIMVDKNSKRRVMSLPVKCTVLDCLWIGELLDLHTHLTIEDKCPQVNPGYDASIVPVWCHQEVSFLRYEILPVYRTIESFSHEQNNAVLFTDPFYTSDGGYRATLAVYPNGIGSGETTHVSVYISLMKGPNDDKLEFPITGIFTVQILNWKENSSHIERSILFDDGTPMEYSKRVTLRERGLGWGYDCFLPHFDMIRYPQSNTVCFKIGFYPIRQTAAFCSPVPSWCNAMHSTSATPPCTRTLYGYSVYKTTNSEWLSQPFYSSGKGYKLQLKVVANGEGAYLSFYVYLLKGEYDDTLSWPFNAIITVQLLNWPSDSHHEEDTIPHHEAPLEYRQKVVEGTTAPGGWGDSHFISHTSLESLNDPAVRFINTDDIICFRIVNVDIIN